MDTDSKQRRKEALKRYRRTPKGRAALKRAQVKYFASEKGKAAQRKHWQSEKRKSTRSTWNESPRGRQTRSAYQSSSKGRAIAASARHARRSQDAMSQQDVTRCHSTRICHYCGVGLDPSTPRGFLCKTVIDHRTPVSRGGTNRGENLVAACWSCNSRKNNKTEAEFFALLARSTYTGTEATC